MYKYDTFDQRILRERVTQFADQTERFLKGELTEEEFRPLRLQNGLYIQRQAPMLRVAVPYGVLSSQQMRALGDIARDFDRGYGHFTTRQNIQFNWPKLADVPTILQRLADVDMHAIQTSGNCVRNTTSDAFAGIAPDETVDPRPYCELIRQWSTFLPEFAALPRKFKIAVTGATSDRAAIMVHDIGIHIRLDEAGKVVADMRVGGGLGRTPIVSPMIKTGLPWQDLLTYCEAVLRVYNQFGRRDNMYKARIKILVKALGAQAFAKEVDAEFAHLQGGAGTLTQAELDRVSAHFVSKQVTPRADVLSTVNDASQTIPFQRWLDRNTHAHKVVGYRAVSLSFKRTSIAPGDASTEVMHAVADLSDAFSQGELVVTHEQNVVLPNVPVSELYRLWVQAKSLGLARANIGLISDMIACPGGDFCALANARSLPIAEAVNARFEDIDFQTDLGDLTLNISGCINSCGHHHIGNIGILGVDKNDEEFYQITLGGHGGNDTKIGTVIGPSFAAEQVPDVIATVLNVYTTQRHEDELFIDVVDRLGIAPFKAAVYDKPKLETNIANAADTDYEELGCYA
jgi:sulfite reductase (NADPH) hemoprotein beta-component